MIFSGINILDTGGATVSLQDNSPQILELLKESSLNALHEIGGTAETHAKEDYVPVDTGHLRDSITYEVDTEAMDVSLSANKEYAAYVELGTRKMKAQPYLKPAIVNHTAEYKKILEDSLKNA